MTTRRVALAKQGERSIVVDDGATAGATLGVDLRWPDGTLVSSSDFGAAPPSTPGVSVTYWRFIREVPANVVALASTITTGLYVITDAGESATRAIEAVSGETTVSNGNGVGGNPSVGLADVEAIVGGSLQLTQFDSKGRRSHEGDATTDDLGEGASNLYYTDARAREAAVADEIDPLVDNVAPSQRAVAEALEGVVGTPGPPGKDGQIRFTGNGPPGTIVGAEPGDTYMDLLTGDIFKLT